MAAWSTLAVLAGMAARPATTGRNSARPHAEADPSGETVRLGVFEEGAT